MGSTDSSKGRMDSQGLSTDSTDSSNAKESPVDPSHSLSTLPPDSSTDSPSHLPPSPPFSAAGHSPSPRGTPTGTPKTLPPTPSAAPPRGTPGCAPPRRSDSAPPASSPPGCVRTAARRTASVYLSRNARSHSTVSSTLDNAPTVPEHGNTRNSGGTTGI